MTGFAESNDQFLEAWKLLSRRAERGTITALDGVVAMYSNVPVSFLNVFGFDSTVADQADLSRRAHVIREYAARSALPYFASVCVDMIPAPARTGMDTAFAGAGLHRFMEWTGMAADFIPPARQPHPAELELRPVTDRAGRIDVSDLNNAAYEMEPEPSREPLAREQLWTEMFGVNGYVEGRPVSTASTLVLGEALYVAFVATHPGHRRRGYAEACMAGSLRRASAASGLSRTVLHATDAGRPVYRKMGYYDVTKFILYAESDSEHA